MLTLKRILSPYTSSAAPAPAALSHIAAWYEASVRHG